jgi:hypothetical protein
VFGLAKLTILLSFTIASFNLDRVRSFLAKHSTQRHWREVQNEAEAAFGNLDGNPSG